MATSTADLLREYDDQLATYGAFTGKLRGLVEELLTIRGQKYHSVTARTKARASVETKVLSGGRRYAVLSDVTDLTGVRIITYFADDVDKVADIITAEFAIDEENSVDKRAVLDPDRFGYLSLHFVVGLRSDRATLLEYSRFTNLKAEIQIRSILQHAWAEIEHDLGYKTALGVPRTFRREFSRLAGLLEIADKEFATIRDDLSEYEQSLAERLRDSPETMLLDKATLGYYMSVRPLFREIENEMASAIETRIAHGDDRVVEWHVETLQAIGISNIAQLEKELSERRDSLPQFAEAWVQQIGRWHGEVRQVTSGFSLQYLAFFIAGEGGDDGCINSLLQRWAKDDPARFQRLADDIRGAWQRFTAKSSDPGAAF